jgi:hypothetical protein
VIGAINISWVIHGIHPAFPGLLLKELSPFVVDKTNLAPLRLLSFFALAITTAHFVRHNNGLQRYAAARLIIRCGQHSLQMFCLGILLSVLGRILLTSFHDGILMQLVIDLAGIVLMAGIAGLLTWYNANNPMRSDAVIVGHTSSADRRWSIAGFSPTRDLTTAIARIERHVIARAAGVGRMWGDQNRAAKRLGIHRQLLNSKAQ